jgi:peroxiredoxin
MNQNVCQRVAAIATLLIFVGCQTETTSSAPIVAAKADAPKPKIVVASNSKTSDASTQQPIAAAISSPKTGNAESSGRQVRTAFYRADAKPTTMPRVLLSKGDEAACKVKVGDVMPAIELPKLGGNDKTKLADLFGKKATVVVFWKGDRRMSQQQLADVATDVVEPFGKQGVSVVGVAVDESAKDVETTLKNSGATFPNLHDADGKAFAQLGNGRFPRTYLLDPSGKIVWFDIEYSLATRRELHQALRAMVGNK